MNYFIGTKLGKEFQKYIKEKNVAVDKRFELYINIKQ